MAPAASLVLLRGRGRMDRLLNSAASGERNHLYGPENSVEF